LKINNLTNFERKNMKKLNVLLFSIIGYVGFSQCSSFTENPNGKPVVVTVTGEDGVCFTLKVNNTVINSTNASAVTFNETVDGGKKLEATLSDGQKITKNVVLPPQLATVYFKLAPNKKGEYDIKLQMFKGDLNAEEKAKNDAEFKAKVQANKDEQAKNDAEWDAKRAAEKEEREKAKENETPKYSIQQVDTKLSTSESKSESTQTTNSTSENSSNTTNTNVEVKTTSGSVSSGSNEYEIQILCNNKPVANTMVTVKRKDFIFGSCMTDETGYCKVKSNEIIDCNYPIDLKGERNGSASAGNGSANASSKWEIEGFFILNCKGGTTFKLEQAAEGMGKMMGLSKESLLKGWGF
jgi:hypothetical protein